MAEITSLGIHKPVALQYLVAEGILPEDSKSELYQWETYVFEEGQGDVEEELLATKSCVVWSQGRFIRNVYRFDLEGEDVVQALLTSFPTTTTSLDRTKHHDTEQISSATLQLPSKPERRLASSTTSGSTKFPRLPTSERALVVFLKSKAHVYFLHGTSHILDLPFEVQRAFPTPRGVLLQRKASPLATPPETPQPPAAPPNSFFLSQIQPSSSYLQSPTLAKSFAHSQPSRPSPLSGKAPVSSLLQDVLKNPDQGIDEEVASLYSLTSPLSDIGVVTFSIQHQKPRVTSKSQPGLSVQFEALDAGDEVVYVSSSNELSGTTHSPLMLLVTANNDLRTLTIWHAWYTEERSLASLLKERAVHKAASARRRSSFLSANIGTGTTTPAVRPRDGMRESLAGTTSVRPPGDTGAPHQPATTSRKNTRQEEEEAMASQMDPDFQPGASQQAVRESRRISSLNADTRQSQYNPHTSFVTAGGRRNTSFGGPNERKSFGHRKSRGSTPGSVFSRSIGADDDFMDLDVGLDVDDEESVESIVRHIRATFDATGAESLLAGAGDEMKRELIVRKLHSIPLAQGTDSCGHASDVVRVVTFSDACPRLDMSDHRLNLYIHQRFTKEVICIQMVVKLRPLWPAVSEAQNMPIPIVASEMKLGQCNDIAKLKDDQHKAVLLTNQGVIFSLEDRHPWALPQQVPYKAYNTTGQPSALIDSDKEVGRNRTLQPPSPDALRLFNPGSRGCFDECSSDKIYHRRQIQLWPKEETVGRVLLACQLLLPNHQASILHGDWCLAHARLSAHPDNAIGTAAHRENVAIVTAILLLVSDRLDEKAKAATNVSRVAAGKKSHGLDLQLHKSAHERTLSQSAAMSWLTEEQRGTPPGISPHIPASRLQKTRPDQLLVISTALGYDIIQSTSLPENELRLSDSDAVKLLLGLHVFREEQKLCRLSSCGSISDLLAAIIAQIGSWLGLPTWSYQLGQYYELEGATEERWAFVKSQSEQTQPMPLMDEPVGVFHWFEHAINVQSGERYPTLDVIAGLDSPTSISKEFRDMARRATPRIAILSDMLEATGGLTSSPARTVELMANYGVTSELMETLPEAIAAPFKDAVVKCEKEPPTAWSSDLLSLVGRDDLTFEGKEPMTPTGKSTTPAATAQHDIQVVCHALDQQPSNARTKEASRHAVSQLIFHEDRRLVEAIGLMHYNSTQVAECPKQPDWTDAQHFEQQRKVMQWVTIRMIALPAGDAMIHFDCQTPLLTDKYHVSGFGNSCLIQPMGHTLTTDRGGLTEEKVNWAYFHAGASAGLRISRSVTGIDTSWIAFNKPNDLTNRHAGLLLALGLNGHLRHLAKWLSFKYLTPKHSMTSVGLLLGLSASYMGTMDGLITRMLSVHITRMLPPGAAELNVSPLTQTAGLIGIGLLYYNTQHRRMSEIMLSEVEHMELEDPDSGPDPLRDECYRLAAGFALGYINLGKGNNLRGLQGMYLPERLLAIAVGPRPVSAVHVFDRATAGAILTLALVYMKSGDRSIARKIDIPDTEAQFDHVRPDMLMLRAMAKHLILWDEIGAHNPASRKSSFIRDNLPTCYQSRFKGMSMGQSKVQLESADVPFFNIATGLAWALSLKYAGSANCQARDEILSLLDMFHRIKSGAEAYYYDAKLARATVRRCIDVLALAAATVMAGTGDLKTFRYLRRLHGRTDAETPYGSHLAGHLAIGALFLGGGTYTFGTSNLAIASLVCAFYPLFPTDVQDNHVHLQALRHFWVFAAEARCLIVEEMDTHRPISMSITVTMKDGATKPLTAPCLLPELDAISTVQTNDPAYWRVTLDFAGNAAHLASFRRNQRIFVRQCPASEAHESVFSSTLAALNPSQTISLPALDDRPRWADVLSDLAVFKDLDKADMELVLPPNVHSSLQTEERGTVVDDRMALVRSAEASGRDTLWNLRVLFAWAEKARDEEGGGLRWLGEEAVEELRAGIEERVRLG